MGVFPSTGYDSDAIPTKKGSELKGKGYMLGQNDWKNVEITGYVKFNSGSEDNFAWYARGGRHTGDGPDGCEGVAYKGDLYFSGKTQIAKEQWHVSYDYSPAKKVMGSIKGNWVGFKFVMYNTFLADGKFRCQVRKLGRQEQRSALGKKSTNILILVGGVEMESIWRQPRPNDNLGWADRHFQMGQCQRCRFQVYECKRNKWRRRTKSNSGT